MGKTVNWKDNKVHYQKTGTGPAVMLLHGFGEDHTIWNKQVNALKGYTFLLPDIPGTGSSELKNNDVSIEDFSEIITIILENERLSTINLGGHSMGGYICMAYAKNNPGNLNSLALIHSSAYADDEEKKINRKKAIEFISANGSQAFLKTAIPGLFMDAEKSASDIDSLIKNSTNSDEALISYYRAMMMRKDNSEVLPELNCPVLYIIGEKDKAVPFQHSLKQCHLPYLSYISILRNSAHMGMLEETGKVNETLAKFLQDTISE